MDSLAAAAAAAAPAAATDAAPAKKSRTQLQKAQDDLTEATTKLAELEAVAREAAALTKGGRRKLTEKERAARDKAAAKATAAVDKQKELLRARQAKYDAKKASADIKATADAAKAAAAAEKLDDARAMTDEGVQQLVTVRLSFQKKFDNKTDQNVNVWEHVAAAYNKLVDDGTLPASDRRMVSSLKSRYSRELKTFSLHCSKVARAKQSGAEVDEDGKPVNLDVRAARTLAPPASAHTLPACTQLTLASPCACAAS